MKVLTVTHSYGQDGGATLLRAAIAHWTRELGWTVDALGHPAQIATLQRELQACGATARGEVDLGAYDAILLNTCMAALRIDGMNAARKGLPLALWVHEGTSVLRHSNTPVSAWVRQFSLCRRIIYSTAWQRDEVFKSFTALVPGERISVIPNGVSVPPVTRAPRPAGSPLRIVCVGSVTGLKRQADLARVVVGLAAGMPVECEFVGSLDNAGSAGPDVAGWVRDPPPMLRWSGSLPHAATLERIAAADLLCLPSADESFALAPMEAAALGVPVLLTRLPVYPHIGWRDGENCLQYRPGDLRGLEEQIRRLAADAALRERLARHGRKLAGKYPLEKTLRTLSGVLQAQFSKTAPR